MIQTDLSAWTLLGSGGAWLAGSSRLGCSLLRAACSRALLPCCGSSLLCYRCLLCQHLVEVGDHARSRCVAALNGGCDALLDGGAIWRRLTRSSTTCRQCCWSCRAEMHCMCMREARWPHALRWQGAQKAHTSQGGLSLQTTALVYADDPSRTRQRLTCCLCVSSGTCLPCLPCCQHSHVHLVCRHPHGQRLQAERPPEKTAPHPVGSLQQLLAQDQASTLHARRAATSWGCSVDMDGKAAGTLLDLTVATDPESWAACWQWRDQSSDRLEAGRHLLRSKQLLQAGQVCSDVCCHCAAGLKLLPSSPPGAVCRADQGLLTTSCCLLQLCISIQQATVGMFGRSRAPWWPVVDWDGAGRE